MSRIRVCLPAAVLAVLAALPLALAAPAVARAQGEGTAPAERAVPVPEDLFAVIALRGKPCGKVVRHERRGETDYLVECQDGHRYRVYVTPDDRVVVQER